jgi:hypothetical protein
MSDRAAAERPSGVAGIDQRKIDDVINMARQRHCGAITVSASGNEIRAVTMAASGADVESSDDRTISY